jgi:hypothetical protein
MGERDRRPFLPAEPRVSARIPIKRPPADAPRTTYDQPFELACYSTDAAGELHMDRSELVSLTVS